jgi:DNA-binding LytR/AlgR family response regulator
VHFWQIQRSMLVNQRRVAGAARTPGGNKVLTQPRRSEELPVSRHFQGQFRDP